MGKVGRALTRPFKAIGHAVGSLFGARSASTVAQSAGAGAAAAPAAEAQNNDTNVDTDATKRKKKAMGKKSLMIGNSFDSADGGTTGTGLNL